LVQRKPSLALGNVLGSCISNALGAFALGLLFQAAPMVSFDRSARVYTAALLAVTTIVAALLATAGPVRLGKAGGTVLVASFVIYLVSIGWAVYRGVVTPPDGSDSDNDAQDDSSTEAGSPKPTPAAATATEESPLVGVRRPRPRRSLFYHICQILLGFLALSLGGFVISHSAASLSVAFGLSGTVMGLTIVSFSTTLPEKFVAVLSSSRGHAGILVAATAGSNIFLLTLCVGVTLLGMTAQDDSLKQGEIVVLWLSAVAFTAVVWFGARRWVGSVLLAGYVAFLVAEFTVWRR
jgi:Ca2+/Na+ antiporter